MALNVENHLDEEDQFSELVALERESRRIYKAAKAIQDSIKSYVDTGDAQIAAATADAATAAAMPAGPAKIAATAKAAADLVAANNLKGAAVSVRQAWLKRFL